MLALQNAPIGAFCNSSMLHLAVTVCKVNFSQNFEFGFLRFSGIVFNQDVMEL